MLKRCIVDPFAERIMKKVQRQGDGEVAIEQAEIQFFENGEATIQQMNDVLKALLKMNQGLTSNLKDWLAVPLLNYLDFLKNSENLKIKFQQDTLIL